jgi:hypothetical protein
MWPLGGVKVGRYVAFAFYERRPQGGMNDYLGDFDTIQEAITFALIDNDGLAKDILHLWEPKALKTHVYVATEDRRGYVPEPEPPGP